MGKKCQIINTGQDDDDVQVSNDEDEAGHQASLGK